MAGINRLGKGPKPPGIVRPPDPNRNRIVDLKSDGANDIEYQRMVKDIEEMQQPQGWLFGRGAFDKADLLYLRDTAEQQRHVELELRDTEALQFAALTSDLDQDDDNSPGSRAGGASSSSNPVGRASKRAPVVKLAKVVKAKPSAQAVGDAAAKRQKIEALGGGPERPAPAPSGAPLEEEANVASDIAADIGGQGLLGLLPDYGSDTDSAGSGAPVATGDGHAQQPADRKDELGSG